MLTGQLTAFARSASSFLRREILAVFLPGTFTIVLLYLVATFEREDGSGLRGIFRYLDNLATPQSALLQLAALVLLLYVSFDVGHASRLSVMTLLRARRRCEYLGNMRDIKADLEVVFGRECVEEVLTQHPPKEPQ